MSDEGAAGNDGGAGDNGPAVPAAPAGPGSGSYAGSGQGEGFDQLTRAAGGGMSRRAMLRLGIGAVVAAMVAWFLWSRRGGSECATGSRCGDRHYCNEDETCICTETIEGNLRCGQLPPYCNVPLCTTSADCAHLGEGWFCDTPDSGCCTDPPAELSRCIAPCGAEYPPPPTTTTTTTTPQDETEEPEEPEEPIDDGEPAYLQRTESQEDGLLFFTRREDGSGEYYFGEVGRGDALSLTHVMFVQPDGTTAAVVVNEDLLPVSWVAPRVSIAARSETRDTPLDPNDALHAVIIDAEETVHRLGLVPGDLRGVVRRGEAITSESYEGARAVLQEASGGWDALVEAALRPGPEQPQRIANAVGMSITHVGAALLNLARGDNADAPPAPDDESSPDPTVDETNAEATDEEAAGLTAPAAPLLLGSAVAGRATASRSVPRQLPGGAIVGPLLETMVKGSLLNLGAETLFGPKPPTDPAVPTMDLLLCQGATSFGTVCHYTYFRRDDIMGCLDFCKTDLSCYTNICAPVVLSAQEAMSGWW